MKTVRALFRENCFVIVDNDNKAGREEKVVNIDPNLINWEIFFSLLFEEIKEKNEVVEIEFIL